MPTRRLIAATALGALVACSRPIAAGAHDEPNARPVAAERTLIVDGVGVARAAPDIATVTMGVETRGATPGAALSANAARVSETLAALNEAGVADKDVRTDRVSLAPQYDYEDRSRPPRVTGYLATVSVRARVRDLTALGGTLDAVVAAGANRLDGLRFGFANAEGLEDAARADAVADARRKAALMAAAADVSLGPILQLSEGGATARPPAPAVQFEAARASATPIARGESEIRATARIVYAIK